MRRLSRSRPWRLAAVGFFWMIMVPVCGFSGTAASTERRTDLVDVPVRKVMLFSSGVGYFEHMGLISGNSNTELRFKTTQINDILKSLVLQDLDGGQAVIVVYPSQEPLTKTLRSFQVDLSNNPSLAEILTQVRGSQVKVTIQAEHLQGTILGLEKTRKHGAIRSRSLRFGSSILLQAGLCAVCHWIRSSGLSSKMRSYKRNCTKPCWH